jgi:membrane dipeptidase
MSHSHDLHASSIVIDGLQAQAPGWEREYLEDMRAGGVTAVNATLSIWEGTRETLNHAAAWHRRARENSDIVMLARSTDDILQAKRDDKTAIIMGFQNTSPLEDDLDMVEVFYQLGVRIIQLTYNAQNSVAAGCWEPNDRGVSEFIGRNMIKEFNRFGILIDVSHCNNQTALDAIELSEQPIAITHGNPFSFVGGEVELPRRNRSDEVLKNLGASGGVIGLSPYPKIAPDGPKCTPERWAEMVEYTVDMIGIDHVGFGTDFCQASPREYILWCRTGRWSRESAIPLSQSVFPDWIKTSAKVPAFTEALVNRGFSDDQVKKVMGENFLRVLRETIDKPSLG